MAILQMDNIMSQNAYGCANCKQSFPMAKYLGIHYQNKECYKVGYSQEKNGKEKVKVKKRKIKSEEKKIKSESILSENFGNDLGNQGGEVLDPLMYLNLENDSEYTNTTPDEKSFPCSYCGKNFSKKFMMKIHERNHTGEKLSPCRFCGKKFNHIYWRNRHEISIHTG